MQSKFVSDGPQRLTKADDARRTEWKQAIAAKYAGQLGRADFFRRVLIKLAMRRELRKTGPSPYTLWLR